MGSNGTARTPTFLVAATTFSLSIAVQAAPVDAIYAAENALYGQGYDIGQADGWMDDRLRGAIRDYQTSSDALEVSGNLDTATLDALGVAPDLGDIDDNALPSRQAALRELGLRAMPEANVTSTDTPATEPQPAPEPEPEPESEPSSEPEPEPEPEQQQAAQTDSQVSVLEPESEQAATETALAEPEPVPEPVAKTAPEPDPEPDSQPQPDVEPESGSDTTSTSASTSQPKPQPATESSVMRSSDSTGRSADKPAAIKESTPPEQAPEDWGDQEDAGTDDNTGPTDGNETDKDEDQTESTGAKDPSWNLAAAPTTDDAETRTDEGADDETEKESKSRDGFFTRLFDFLFGWIM